MSTMHGGQLASRDAPQCFLGEPVGRIDGAPIEFNDAGAVCWLESCICRARDKGSAYP
jgi:hypothetical protein